MEAVVLNIKKEGFAAVLSVIVLSAVALGVLGSVSVLAVGGSRITSQEFSGYKAKSIADSCMEVALQVIRDNTAFTGSDNLTLSGGSCTYAVTDLGGENRQITFSGTYKNVVRKAVLVTSALSPQIVISSYQEVP